MNVIYNHWNEAQGNYTTFQRFLKCRTSNLNNKINDLDYGLLALASTLNKLLAQDVLEVYKTLYNQALPQLI